MCYRPSWLLSSLTLPLVKLYVHLCMFTDNYYIIVPRDILSVFTNSKITSDGGRASIQVMAISRVLDDFPSGWVTCRIEYTESVVFGQMCDQTVSYATLHNLLAHEKSSSFPLLKLWTHDLLKYSRDARTQLDLRSNWQSFNIISSVLDECPTCAVRTEHRTHGWPNHQPPSK